MKHNIDIDELAVELHNLTYKWALLGGEKDFMVLEQLVKACKESPFHKLKNAFKSGWEEGHWDRLTKEEKARKRLEELDYPDPDKNQGLSR